MKREDSDKIFNVLPESFYDILAYIIPSTFLVVGILYHCDLLNLNIINWSSKPESWVFDLFFSFLLLGGLYYLGAVITTFSYFLIHIPIVWVTKLFKKKDKYYFNVFGTEILKLRIDHPFLSTCLTKRYARLNLSRNTTFSCIILLVVEIFSFKSSAALLIYIAASIFSLISTWIRLLWLNENFEALQEKLT